MMAATQGGDRVAALHPTGIESDDESSHSMDVTWRTIRPVFQPEFTPQHQYRFECSLSGSSP
jgi:hypothetical protein